MSNNIKTDPLLDWNRLARENTENAMVSSMYEAAACAIEPLDKFATWLLIGSTAIASFFITNSEKISPILESRGFLLCGAMLCFSCFFGFLAKLYALKAQITQKTSNAVRETFLIHLANHQAEELKIQENADFFGIDLQTGIRMERVLSEFAKPLPWWAKFLINRQLKINKYNPQVAYLGLIRNINMLGYFTTAQTIFILGFLISGFIYAA